MALSRVKRWNRNEILLSTDLNAEFDNIVNNASTLVFPLVQDLDVGGYLMNDTGFTAPIQLHENLQSLDGKYANDIGAAIAGIGLTSVTLIIAAPTTVSGTYSVPSNIHLWFVGQGNLSINGGSTLTITNPSQITATTNQTLFGGAGTVLFTQAGIVSPCWWGFLPTSTGTVNVSAYNACTASLPTTGGIIVIPPGTYSVNATLTHGNKPISVIGAQADSTIIESTAASSLTHGMVFTRSFVAKGFTIRVATPLTVNYSMKAINFDSPSTTGQSYYIEAVKSTGFNIGLYADGGSTYAIDSGYAKLVDITVAGPASSYVGSCLNMNRITNLTIEMPRVNQNDCGDHAIYLFGCKNLTIKEPYIRGASTTSSQAIKIVGNGSGSSSTVYENWRIENPDIDTCFNGILVTTFSTEVLNNLHIVGGTLNNITGEAGGLGAISLSIAGTSRIRNVVLDGQYFGSLGFRAVHVSMASGAFLDQLTWINATAYSWSTSSSGTYSLYGQDSTGTNYHSHLENITADGNSTGRCILNTNSLSTGCKRFTYKNLIQRNITTDGFPITISGQSGAGQALNFAFGTTQYLNNSGACAYTTATNAVAGERYVFIGANANSTITDNATFNLSGGNWVSASGAYLALECLDNTPTFYETGRGTT